MLPDEIYRLIYRYVYSYSINIINNISQIYSQIPINTYKSDTEFIDKANFNIIPSKYIELNKILLLFNINIEQLNNDDKIFILQKIINFNCNTCIDDDEIKDAIINFYQNEYTIGFEDDDNYKLYISTLDNFDEYIKIEPLLKTKYKNNVRYII
jgi:hypothetical protein